MILIKLVVPRSSLPISRRTIKRIINKMSQSKPFIISDVRIFTGDYFIEHGHVLVEGSKIKSVSVGNPLSTPRDVQVISKPGCTLLPGLIDAHIHADQGNTTSLEQSLNFGVTTVCDMSNEAWNIEKLVPVCPIREWRSSLIRKLTRC